MALNLTDNWQMAKILTDNWHLYPPSRPSSTFQYVVVTEWVSDMQASTANLLFLLLITLMGLKIDLVV